MQPVFPFRRPAENGVRMFEVEPAHWVEASAMPRLAQLREASLAGPC